MAWDVTLHSQGFSDVAHVLVEQGGGGDGDVSQALRVSLRIAVTLQLTHAHLVELHYTYNTQGSTKTQAS